MSGALNLAASPRLRTKDWRPNQGGNSQLAGSLQALANLNVRHQFLRGLLGAIQRQSILKVVNLRNRRRY